MSLPKRNEREYLEIKDSGDGFVIRGKRGHAEEIGALLKQHGIFYEWRQASTPDSYALHFPKDANRATVAEVLESYKNAKGS